MNSFIDIFSLTSPQYADRMRDLHNGKGRLQAIALYKAIMKKGRGFSYASETKEILPFDAAIADHIPAFSNAPQMRRSMCELTRSGSRVMSIRTIVSDGSTTKLLFGTYDGYEVESVVIPMQSKHTLCISSQVGCKMGCAFCETGRMGLIRNLTVSEIVQQVFIAQHILKKPIHNVVFMGMGEPFDNYEAVLQAVSVLVDMQGLSFGLKNITISTSGRVEEIRRFTQEKTRPTPNLAVSINSADDAVRTKLMPHNRKEPLSRLIEAVKEYIEVKDRDVLFAYVLMKGINDSEECAYRLISLVAPFHGRVKINLIPYNPQSCDRFQPPAEEVIDRFSALLRQGGIRVLLRKTKGRSIMAGCGQLGNLELRKKRVLNPRTPPLPIVP